MFFPFRNGIQLPNSCSFDHVFVVMAFKTRIPYFVIWFRGKNIHINFMFCRPFINVHAGFAFVLINKQTSAEGHRKPVKINFGYLPVFNSV